MLAMTHHNDLRGYLEALDELGDLTRIGREVSWNLGASAITRLSYERSSPAALFENIHGVAPGFRLLGAPAGISSIRGKPLARIALSVGLAADTSPARIVDHLAHARDLPPIPPNKVTQRDAVCKQNILRGEQASLDRFPIPQIHLQDGGRYANTWGVIVARTPDGAWTNWTITRIMMIDGKHMTGLVIPSQHLGLIWTQWAKIGKPMPYALVQGAAAAVPVVGGLPLPQGVDESGYVGALVGEPLSHEFVHRIGKVLQLSRSGRHAPQAYVLDDDIDPADDTDLIWALATRVHPDHRAEPWLGPINPLMTSYTPTEHASHMGPVVVHDALLPAGGHGRLPHSSFAQAYPRQIQDRVLAHWNG
jgi:3-polyprenyl-4-hydroxybenzoate decarboxylase